MNKIFKELSMEKISNLKREYNLSKRVFYNEESKKLIHPGEYGIYREKAVIELLELFIPQKFKICSGFIITSTGKTSTQCDLIIYNPETCPKISDAGHQNFIPIESVLAVGEIKSDIKNSKDLTKILNKLSKIKSLKKEILDPMTIKGDDYDPRCYFNHIFTFIISKELPSEIKYDKNVDISDKHNIILSLEGRYFCYELYKNQSFPYPNILEKELSLVKREEGNNDFPEGFLNLLTSISNHLQNTQLLTIDFVHYLTNSYSRDLDLDKAGILNV